MNNYINLLTPYVGFLIHGKKLYISKVEFDRSSWWCFVFVVKVGFLQDIGKGQRGLGIGRIYQCKAKNPEQQSSLFHDDVFLQLILKYVVEKKLGPRLQNRIYYH